MIPLSPFANDGDDLVGADATMDLTERWRRDGDGDVLFCFLNRPCQDVFPPKVESSSIDVLLDAKENLEDQAEPTLLTLVCSVMIEAIFVF